MRLPSAVRIHQPRKLLPRIIDQHSFQGPSCIEGRRTMNNRMKLIAGVIVVAAFIFVGIIVLTRRDDDLVISVDETEMSVKTDGVSDAREQAERTVDVSVENVPTEGVSEQGKTTETLLQSVVEKEILVHVCGCVNSPGVYSLSEDSRVFEAIEKAGGFSTNAEEAYLNLAATITDGSKLYVPSKDEVSDGLIPVSVDEGVISSEKSKININSATKEQLMTLSGVGESKAESIISYRNEHGRFGSTEDIMNIPGIKEALFSKIKDDITV